MSTKVSSAANYLSPTGPQVQSLNYKIIIKTIIFSIQFLSYEGFGEDYALHLVILRNYSRLSAQIFILVVHREACSTIELRLPEFMHSRYFTDFF